MKLKIGDRVKFLNESGGGVISKVISSKMVHVTIEDGFDIPTLTSDLLKTEEMSGAGTFINEPYQGFDSRPPAEQGFDEAIQFEDRQSELINIKTGKTYPSGIYLAFVPEEQKWLITGLLDIYLINHTEFDILYSFILSDQKGKFIGLDYANISPRSRILIDSIDREDINDWCEGHIQIMFQKEISKQIVLPVHSNFRFKPSKLYKEANYHHASFMPERAFMLNIIEMSQATNFSGSDEAKKMGANKTTIKEAKQAIPEAMIDRHKIKPRVAEVDLHISALKDDFSTLSNHEILKTQINYFTRSLESALKNHYVSVYFIHGIGNGVLKTAIKEIMKDYSGIEYRAAPYDRYGTGAIEVVIRESY